MLEQSLNWIFTDQASNIFKALLILLFGFFIAKLASRTFIKMLSNNISQHHVKLFSRLVYWLFLALFVASALNQLGFSLSVLLGAAGVLSVAIGFASQTSASNLISGLFLIGERPFLLGDTIKVGNTTGEVLSIDLLSVKLRTADNLFVRIPNETLIKTEVTNLTRFPIRRFDLTLSVSYKEDIARVREILLDVANNNPLCLDEPAPVFNFVGFGDTALNVQLTMWGASDTFSNLKNSVQESVKIAFDKAKVSMPTSDRTFLLINETSSQNNAVFRSSTNTENE